MTMTIVVDAKTATISDWGIANQVPAISTLGPESVL
jgi:hypothetical protein